MERKEGTEGRIEGKGVKWRIRKGKDKDRNWKVEERENVEEENSCREQNRQERGQKRCNREGR